MVKQGMKAKGGLGVHCLCKWECGRGCLCSKESQNLPQDFWLHLCVKGAAPGAVGCSEALTNAAKSCVEGMAEGQLWDGSLGVTVDSASAQIVGICSA